MEMTPRGRDFDPVAQSSDEGSSKAEDVGLSPTTSEDNSPLSDAWDTDDSSEKSCWGRVPAYDTERRDVSRGRRRYRQRASSRNRVSSLSSGMIRTAVLGLALQGSTVVDVSPSAASSGENFEVMSPSCSDIERLSDCNSGHDDANGQSWSGDEEAWGTVEHVEDISEYNGQESTSSSSNPNTPDPSSGSDNPADELDNVVDTSDVIASSD